MLGELTKSLPPEVQAAITDFVIEATDLPNRREIAERVRRTLGIQDVESMTPEEQAQMQQQIAAEQAKQAQMEQLQARAIAAAAADKEAGVAHKLAQTRKTHAEAERTEQEVDLAGDLRQMRGDVDALAGEMIGNIPRLPQGQPAAPHSR
jgi:hypothetical protein